MQSADLVVFALNVLYGMWNNEAVKITKEV